MLPARPLPVRVVVAAITCLAVALLAVTTLSPSPATAAAQSGTLQIKGPGSNFAPATSMTSVAVGAGSTASFGVKVLNTGAEVAQFKISTVQSGQPARVQVYAGGSLVSPLDSGPDGYFTNALSAGASQLLSLRVTPPVGATQGTTTVDVVLSAVDGTEMTQVQARTEVKAPAKGSTSYNVVARQGLQPFVGGDFVRQVASAPALAMNAATQFDVRLRNDGATPVFMRFVVVAVEGCEAGFPITVRDGLRDVTAAVLSGTYRTPVLAPGSSKTLSVAVKRQSGGPGCDGVRYIAATLTMEGFSHSAVFLNVNRAA